MATNEISEETQIQSQNSLNVFLDKNLNERAVRTFGLLCQVTPDSGISNPSKVLGEKFGMAPGWFHRSIKSLQELGYIEKRGGSLGAGPAVIRIVPAARAASGFVF